MLKKIIKMVSLLVAIMMLASIFAGCGTSKEDEKTTVQTGQQDSTAAVPEDKGYVPPKDLEISIWNTQGTDVSSVENPKENIPSDWLVQKTRVKITEYYGNGGQQWEPKLTALVAGGNLPSLVLTQAGQGPAHHAKLHEGDLNWELTPEMLQKYAPDIWKGVPQFVWDSIKIDGKLYGVPFSLAVDKEMDPGLSDDFLNTFTLPRDSITWSGMAPNSLGVRDDILKKLIPSAMNYEEIMKSIQEKNAPIGDDLVLPIKTTDEYVKFMYDIKALGLTEGNKPVYALGYTGGDCWLALSQVGAEMLGYKGYYYTGWLNINQKKMDFGYLNPVFKEAARIQVKMINDKVIDPESLIHNIEKFKEKVLNGNYGIVGVGDAGGFNSINTQLEKAGKSFRYVPFFTQVEQRADFPAFKEGPPVFYEALSILKTVKEEDVPQILNWMNIQFTDEWDDIRFWGTKEAGLYEELTDGTRKFKDEKMQKLLVDGDLTAMDAKDAKGLSSNAIASGYTWKGVIKWTQNASKFSPQFFNKMIKYSTNMELAMKFPSSSPWTQGFVPVPNIQSWSAEYANIPEIQKLWSARASWDDPFKVAFTAKDEEDFNKKWDAAVANLRKVIDVDKMLEEQTKIMLPLLEKRTAQAK